MLSIGVGIHEAYWRHVIAKSSDAMAMKRRDGRQEKRATRVPSQSTTIRSINISFFYKINVHPPHLVQKARSKFRKASEPAETTLKFD